MLSLDYRVEMIERPFAARVLLALYRFGKVNRGTLYAMLESSPQTPIKRIEELMEAGLIVEFKEDRKRYLKLTEIGLKAAMAVDALENALRSAEPEK
jgi:DNA-binding MarR family transcriptional regulator